MDDEEGVRDTRPYVVCTEGLIAARHKNKPPQYMALPVLVGDGRPDWKEPAYYIVRRQLVRWNDWVKNWDVLPVDDQVDGKTFTTRGEALAFIAEKKKTGMR